MLISAQSCEGSISACRHCHTPLAEDLSRHGMQATGHARRSDMENESKQAAKKQHPMHGAWHISGVPERAGCSGSTHSYMQHLRHS